MKQLLQRLRAAFGNLAPRERLLVSIVGVILAATVLWLGIVQPVLAAGARVEQRVVLAEQQLEVMKRLRREFDDVNHRLTDVEQRIADGSKGNLRTTLETLARQAAVTIESMEPQASPANDRYRETKVEVGLKQVSLPQTVRYLHEIEETRQVLSVKALRIRTRVDQPDLLDVTVLLTLFFLFLGFPYDRLGERLAAELSRGNGTQLSFQELGPFISLAGPGFEATGARITTADGDGIHLRLDRARLRPAWSLAWLRLVPAIHLDLQGPPGNIVGVVTLGQEPGFEGQLEAIDLAQLPKNLVAFGAVLAGTLDAAVDLRAGSPGPQGSISLSAREGSLGAPDLLPMAVPFDELSASLRLGDGAFLEVESFETQSPLFSAQVSGTIATAPSFVDAPLNLQVKLQTDPAFRNTLQGLGIRVSRDGKATLRIRGTPTTPILR